MRNASLLGHFLLLPNLANAHAFWCVRAFYLVADGA